MIRGVTMERREKGYKWYWVSLIVVAVAAILTGYLVGLERGFEKEITLLKRDIQPAALRSEGSCPSSPRW